MQWQRVSVLPRLFSLLLGVASFGVARFLTRLGTSGGEDVPPPFIVAAGLAGFLLLGIALTGRAPRVGATRPPRDDQ